MEAKLALRGNYRVMIMGMLMTTLASMLASTITDFFFPENGTFTFVLSEIFAFVVSIVLTLIAAGYDRMNLQVARRQGTQLGEIWYFFKNGSDRVLTAGIVMTVLQFLASLPLLIFNKTVVVERTAEGIMNYQISVLKLMLFTLVLQTIFTLPFGLVYYLLTDHPEMGGIEALKTSIKMLKGNMAIFLILHISFLPWLFASMFTFGIALLWVIPYMNMTFTEFYRDLNGEIDFYLADPYAEYRKIVNEVPVEETEEITEELPEDHSEE